MPRPLIFLFPALALALAAAMAPISAQDAPNQGAPDTSNKASQALEAPSQADAESSFFGDDQSMAETQAPTKGSGLDQFRKDDQGVKWGGTLKSDIGWYGGWIGQNQWPDPASLTKNWGDDFSGDFEGKIYLDARPEKAYRVKVALWTAWPFANDAPLALPSPLLGTTTVAVPNIKLWELFADINIQDRVFVRIGKQVNSWGLLGSAYSPTDVISLTPKDVTDLTAEREGPLALKVTVPESAWNANFTGLILARDDYFSSDPTWRDVGYAAKGEILLKYTEVALGGFYQRSAAPKLIGTLTSGLGYLPLPFVRDINIFSESALSWGSDKLLGTGTSPFGTFTSLDKPDSGLYYLGTLGASYSNSDYNYSVSLEYFFNGLGSNDIDYAGRAYATYASQGGSSSPLTIGDLLNPGMHNLTGFLTFTDIDGSKFGSTTIWQQNFSDKSGWLREKVTFDPWDYVSFYAGFDFVYGAEGTEFTLTHMDPYTGATERLFFFLGTTMGTGSF